MIHDQQQPQLKKKMNNKKVHSHMRVRSFSWEGKPGVTKVEMKTTEEYYPADDHERAQAFKVKLPPPPCPPEKYRALFHDFLIPPPPCAFQPPLRSSSRRGLRKNDDPFLMAYKECTKSSRKDHKLLRFGLKKNMSVFSCKNSCSVINDSIIKTSHLPISRSKRESHED